jgi:8-oxo-dGTP diphosphatase
MNNNQRPKVGVGIIVVRKNKVLLEKRKNSHGDGTWSFPGGHLEFNERIESCAKREILEETGLIIKDIKMEMFTNDIFKKENKHYVTLFVSSISEMGDPQVMEPDKCEKLEWFEWNNLPRPLFIPVQNLLRQGYNPFS